MLSHNVLACTSSYFTDSAKYLLNAGGLPILWEFYCYKGQK